MSKLISALVNVLSFAGYVLVEYFAYLSFLRAPAGVDPLLAGFVAQALVALMSSSTEAAFDQTAIAMDS